MSEITIPMEKYDELIDLKSRVGIIAEIFQNEDFISKEKVLRILSINKTDDAKCGICKKDKDISFEKMLN